MGAADLISLKSRAVRKTVGKDGVRILRSIEGPLEAEQGLLGFVKGLWKKATAAAPWLDDAWLALQIGGAFVRRRTWQGLLAEAAWILLKKYAIKLIIKFLRWFVTNGVRFIWHFDLNASDESLIQQMKARREALALHLAGFTGCTIGHIVVGKGMPAAATVLRVPKGAIYRMRQEGGEEAVDEFAANLAAFAQTASDFLAKNLMTSLYLNGRNWVSAGWSKLWGIDKSVMKNSEANDAEPFILANQFEEKVIPWLANKIPGVNEMMLEEFFEELFECAGDIILMMLDSAETWYEEQQLQKDAILGEPLTVELTPDRSNPNEKFLLNGRTETVKPAISNALVQYYAINNRDVGQIVGRDLPRSQQQKPLTKTLYLSLTWKAQSKPPYPKIQYNGKMRHMDANIEIPFVNPSVLTWKNIKQAMGILGHKFGRYRAYGWLNRIKVEVFGETESFALARLEALAELCEGELYSIGTSNKVSTGGKRNNVQYYPIPILLYPAYGFITAQKKILGNDSGKSSIEGNYESRKQRFELWLDDEPDYFRPLIEDLKKYHTPLAT